MKLPKGFLPVLIVLCLSYIIYAQRSQQNPIPASQSQTAVNPGQEGGQVYTGLGNNPIYGGMFDKLFSNIDFLNIFKSPKETIGHLAVKHFSVQFHAWFFSKFESYNISVNLVPFGPDAGDQKVHPGMLTSGQTIDMHMFFPFYGGLYNYSVVRFTHA